MKVTIWVNSYSYCGFKEKHYQQMFMWYQYDFLVQAMQLKAHVLYLHSSLSAYTFCSFFLYTFWLYFIDLYC